MDIPSEDLPSEWFRGILDPCLLALVGDGETYGYELAGRLEDAGLGRVKGGSLYPSLARLERQGWLASQWRAGDGGPGRKYYALTDAGRAELTRRAQLWDVFATRVADVLGAEVAP
ncbi:MAG: PadR family transcriptional regulator [Actinomycetota bacterium]